MCDRNLTFTFGCTGEFHIVAYSLDTWGLVHFVKTTWLKNLIERQKKKSKLQS